MTPEERREARLRNLWTADRWVIESPKGFLCGSRTGARWASAPVTTYWFLLPEDAEDEIRRVGLGGEAWVVPYAQATREQPYRVEAVTLRNGRMRWELVQPDRREALCVDHDHEDAYTLRHCSRACAKAETWLLLLALEEGIVRAFRSRLRRMGPGPPSLHW